MSGTKLSLSPESEVFFLLRNLFLSTDGKKRACTFVMLLPCVVFRTEGAEINHLQASILSFD